MIEPNIVGTRASGMRLHALDVWLRDAAVLTNSDALRGLLYRAALAGGATVLADGFDAVPNGAVPGVLRIHPWPELRRANVDLLTSGHVEPDAVLGVLQTALRPERVSLVGVTRGIG